MKLPVPYKELYPTERIKVRAAYVNLQGGRCYYCKELLTNPPAQSVTVKKVQKDLFPEKFFTYPIHLHHSRKTGLTIGAVHCYCNAVLWQYEGE